MILQNFFNTLSVVDLEVEVVVYLVHQYAKLQC